MAFFLSDTPDGLLSFCYSSRIYPTPVDGLSLLRTLRSNALKGLLSSFLFEKTVPLLLPPPYELLFYPLFPEEGPPLREIGRPEFWLRVFARFGFRPSPTYGTFLIKTSFASEVFFFLCLPRCRGLKFLWAGSGLTSLTRIPSVSAGSFTLRFRTADGSSFFSLMEEVEGDSPPFVLSLEAGGPQTWVPASPTDTFSCSRVGGSVRWFSRKVPFLPLALLRRGFYRGWSFVTYNFFSPHCAVWVFFRNLWRSLFFSLIFQSSFLPCKDFSTDPVKEPRRQALPLGCDKAHVIAIFSDCLEECPFLVCSGTERVRGVSSLTLLYSSCS